MTVRVNDSAHGRNELHRYTPPGGKQAAEVVHDGVLGGGNACRDRRVRGGPRDDDRGLATMTGDDDKGLALASITLLEAVDQVLGGKFRYSSERASSTPTTLSRAGRSRRRPPRGGQLSSARSMGAQLVHPSAPAAA